MIFKCGCKSVVGHDSEGDATLTLEHSSTCKHTMTEIEKLRAENVELARAIRLLRKLIQNQFNVIRGVGELDKKLAVRANDFSIKVISSSPSAKWVEAVEKLKDAIRELKKNTGDDWDSYWMEVEVAFDYLELIEEKQ